MALVGSSDACRVASFMSVTLLGGFRKCFDLAAIAQHAL